MTENKNTPQTSVLHVLRTQTTLIPNVNGAALAAVSFTLLLSEEGKSYRITNAFTDMDNNNILFDDSLYPFLRDGDKVKAIIQNNNVLKLVENLTLKKEMNNYLNQLKKTR